MDLEAQQPPVFRGYNIAQVIAKTSSCSHAWGERLNEYEVGEDDSVRSGMQGWDGYEHCQDYSFFLRQIIAFILHGGFMVIIKFSSN